MVKYIYIFFLLLSGCKTANISDVGNNNIRDYLNLDIRVSKDTVSFNDIVNLTFIFENKADSSVWFYPEAISFLEDNYIYSNEIYIAGEISIYEINSSINSNNLILLNPGDKYSLVHQVKIQKPFFITGENEVVVIYGHGYKDQKKINRKKRIVYGKLVSPPFKIYVNEKIYE